MLKVRDAKQSLGPAYVRSIPGQMLRHPVGLVSGSFGPERTTWNLLFPFSFSPGICQPVGCWRAEPWKVLSAITGKSKVPISLGCEYKVEVEPWVWMDGCPGYCFPLLVTIFD